LIFISLRKKLQLSFLCWTNFLPLCAYS